MAIAVGIACGGREPRVAQHMEPPRTTRVIVDASVPKADCSAEVVSLRDVEQLRSALARERCNGNAFDGHRTPLTAAAERGDLAAVDLLLRAGADPNAALALSSSADTGKTPLWFAVAGARADIVERLLAAHADPNLFPPQGLPLLVLAQVKNSVPIARLLIGAGIDPRQKSARGATVMTYANGPSAEMFAYLTSAGVPADGLPRDVIESLQWESAHAPGPGATTAEVVQFAIEVIRKTRSARARELAIERIQQAGRDGASAVRALVEVIRGSELSPTDWSRVRAADALRGIGWSAELEPLVAVIPTAPQQLRLAIAELVATAPTETRRKAVAKLKATKTRDRAAIDEAIKAIEAAR